MEIDLTYEDISLEKPVPGRTIDYIDSNGRYGTGVYLCKCCRSEWRCEVTGGGIIIDVVQWRYTDQL